MSHFTAAQQQWLLTATWVTELRTEVGRCCHALVRAQVVDGLRHGALGCDSFEDESFAIAWLQAYLTTTVHP